jgi:hypothetical protein
MRIVRPSDLAEAILDRLNTYGSALQGDLRRWRASHGEAVVNEALSLIERQGRVSADLWDAQGHAHAVRVGLMRAIDGLHDEDET